MTGGDWGRAGAVVLAWIAGSAVYTAIVRPGRSALVVVAALALGGVTAAAIYSGVEAIRRRSPR